MAGEIQYSQNFDQAAPIIQDFVPERMIKVFPYELVAADKSKAFMEQNGVSIAAISQLELDTADEVLEQEADGSKYFQMFAAITSSGKLDLSTQTSVYGQELKEEDEFTGLSNYFYEGELSDIQLGGGRLLPAVFTIGIPFDKDKFEAGEQAMFIASSIVEAQEGQAQFANEEINPEGLYEYSLINMTAIEAQFTNSRIFFSKVLGDHLLTSEKKLLPKTKLADGSEVPGISIELKTDSLISRIDGKGTVENIDSDIDLKVTEELTVLKATPIDIQDKLTMFMDWFDYDTVMPEFIARQFVDGMSIEDLKNIDIDNNGTKEPFFGDEEINLITDMLAYSAAFANSFANFERNDTGSDAGKIKSNQVIGSKKAKLVALEGKDSVKVIDGLYEDYIRKNPQDDNSIQFRAMKQILAALSRYIYSNYAIGKGENSFNQVYLPWYLLPQESIDVVEGANNQWIFDKTKKFELASRWFTIENGAISPMKEVKISDVKLVQTDRKLTMPEVPDTIQALNKLPLPGDVSTNSSSDLMYYWYLPINGEEFNKLYLNDASVTTDNKDKNKKFTTVWTDYGEALPIDLNNYVKQQAKSQFKAKIDNIHWVSNGNLEVQTEPTVHTNDFRVSTAGVGGNTPSGNQAAFATPEFSSLRTTGLNSGDTIPITDKSVVEAFIAAWLGKPKELVEVVDNNMQYLKINDNTGAIRSFKTTYKLKRQRLVDAEVTINGRTTTVSIDRDTLFDKVGWHFFINDYLSITSNWKEYHLVEERGLDIEKINEIVISQVWGNSARIHIGVDTIEIPLFNKDDESIGVQRILFT